MSNIDGELDRQRVVLVEHGLPNLVGLADDAFTEAVETLRPALRDCMSDDPTQGRAPFVLVASGGPVTDMAAVEQQVPLLRLAGGSVPGVLDRNHGEQGLAPYRPIDEVGSPPAPVYALVDVDRGEEFRGVPPRDALPMILERGRSPLTIAEGIAFVLLYPQVLEKNACFMLSGSRRGDRRVPALWISGKAPKLGWCWDGNPHDWLGVANAETRMAAGGGGERPAPARV
ncbi:MAG: DUF5701 family protein [Egibacteraceae bacterium]